MVQGLVVEGEQQVKHFGRPVANEDSSGVASVFLVVVTKDFEYFLRTSNLFPEAGVTDCVVVTKIPYCSSESEFAQLEVSCLHAVLIFWSVIDLVHDSGEGYAYFLIVRKVDGKELLDNLTLVGSAVVRPLHVNVDAGELRGRRSGRGADSFGLSDSVGKVKVGSAFLGLEALVQAVYELLVGLARGFVDRQ